MYYLYVLVIYKLYVVVGCTSFMFSFYVLIYIYYLYVQVTCVYTSSRY